MSKFDIKNWYWRVDGGNTQVYSSASRSYVDIADSAYQNWLGEGNHPTPITASDLPAVVNKPIFDQLQALDFSSARALRAIAVAQANNQSPDPDDINALKEHEASAASLREELL